MRKYLLILLFLLFASSQAYGQLDFSVEFRLRPQADKRYLTIENAEIKTLSSRHGVTLTQSYPNARTPELLSLYTLTIKGSYICTESVQSTEIIELRQSIIRDFLATGKFEDDIRESVVYSVLCANSVSVNDPDFQNTHGWPLRLINAPCAWTITRGNPNILIGIADTEFRTTHE